MTFAAADVNALFAGLVSHALKLGIFARVNQHDPENVPGPKLSCSITLATIEADPAASGLAAVSGKITFMVRIWSPMVAKPLDTIDPAVLSALSTLLGEYSGNFTLAGTVRDIDLMALRAQTGYLDQDGKQFRVAEITLPIVVNDLWGEVA
jgi:hypothetical protein